MSANPINPTLSEGFKYIIPVTATVEKDPNTGLEFIYCRITNPYIKETKSSQDVYIQEWKLQKDALGNYVRYNPNDANDIKEMKISKEIRAEIHEIWKLLNPSGTPML